MATFIERLDPWLNPILVRTLGQGLRSRLFASAYLVATLGAAVATLFVLAMPSSNNEGQAGSVLFWLVTGAWGIHAWVMQPSATAALVQQERTGETWELLTLTGMRPRAVVLGLIGAALSQTLLIGAALSPFLVLAYLLRGVGLDALITVAWLIPLGSLASASALVWLCCVSQTKRKVQTGAFTVVFVVAALIIFANVLLRGGSTGGFGLETSLATANALIMATLVFVVLAITVLTPIAQDRSSGPRLMWWLVWLNLAGWIAVDPSTHGWEFLAGAGLVWFCILGWCAVSEPEDLTPRQRQDDARLPLWRQPFQVVLGPGAARGRRWLAVSVMMAWVPTLITLHDAKELLLVTSYGLAILALGEPALRLFGARWLSDRARLRAALFGLAVLWFLVGAMVGMERDRYPNPMSWLVFGWAADGMNSTRNGILNTAALVCVVGMVALFIPRRTARATRL